MVIEHQKSGAAEGLRAKLHSNEASMGIIGLGYVGLPLAHALARGGAPVVGFDIDPSKIESLKDGRNYLTHLGDQIVKELFDGGRFDCTTDFDRLAEVDVVIVCVPTPLGPHREPDLSYVLSSAREIGKRLHTGQLVVLESTSFPGTTRDEMLPVMLASVPESAGDLQVGRDFFMAFSPEREDPGRATHTTSTIPKLVGGVDDVSTELATLVYEKGVEHVVPVATAEIAEASKLLENIFRAVNIALVNEMKMVLTQMDVDIWDVVRAASTKPFGFMPFYPGPGLGGHCIPIDPFYLSWKAKELDRSVQFIELAGMINTHMPTYVMQRTMEALNACRKPVNGSRVLVLGLAYKAGIGDTRESPSYTLIEGFRESGAHVDYSDSLVPVAEPVRKHDLGMKSVDLTAESVASYDVVVIATAHPGVDLALLAEHAQLIVDTRDAMREFQEQLGARLVKA
ncbi:MAG: UDP-N-acetyl-D-glucosamine dehydrogenase [Chlamydiales bacterium]